MILAGFAIQAEYGDWHEHHAEITPEHYFPQRTLRRIGRAYAKDNIPERHKVHQGLTDEEAEYGYVKVKCEYINRPDINCVQRAVIL